MLETRRAIVPEVACGAVWGPGGETVNAILLLAYSKARDKRRPLVATCSVCWARPGARRAVAIVGGGTTARRYLCRRDLTRWAKRHGYDTVDLI